MNLAVTLGSNMYAGAHAQSTFPTRRPSHKVSTSPHHDNKQSLGLGLVLLRKKAINHGYTQGGKKCYTFIFVVCCHGEKGITGTYSSLQEMGGGRKVIINHIYDAVREPT